MTGFQDMGDTITYVAIVLLPCLSGGLLAALARHARCHPDHRRAWVLVGANLLVFVVLLSVLFLILESYYRFWCDTTDSFGLTRVSQRWIQRHFQMNQTEARDNIPVYPLQRMPGHRRITFLGDSFTEGHGVANVDDRFANRIRKRKRDWEIHVMAHSGFDTGDELLTAQKFVKQKYQLDQVVLVYCLNDIADIDPEWQSVCDRIDRTKDVGFLLEHSFCLNTYYYRLKARFDPDISNYYHFVRKAYDGPLWEEQKQRLKSLRDAIESNGGHFLVVTFPFLHQLGPGYEYGPVHEKLDAFWRSIGVPHLDLLRVYTPHQGERLTVNPHDAHPNEYAHALAAEAILGFLEQNISTNGQPRSATPRLNPG